MADDQQPPAQRYWFPYWTAPPQPPPPPPAPAPRPAVRPQLSRREPRPAPQPSPPPVIPPPSRRQPHPQPASRGAGGVPAPPAQPQPTRLPSRPSPSPSRAPPLSPIREPNARAPPEPVPVAKEERKPPSPLHPVAHDVPKQKDMIVPQEKTIHEPPLDSKTQSKALEKEKEKEKEKKKDKDEEKEKKKDKEEHKDKKDKDKEKEHKEKGKDKEKEHKEKEKEHGSKLHKELKAGVADMVQKLSSSAPSSGGHERAASAAAGAGTTIITLAGENKGASMKVDSSAVADVKPDAAGSKDRRGHKLDGGVVVGGKETAPAGGKGLTAFVNSNVQAINNSLLLQSSCNGGDPGVHLKLSTRSKKKDGEEAGGKSGSAAAPGAWLPISD